MHCNRVSEVLFIAEYFSQVRIFSWQLSLSCLLLLNPSITIITHRHCSLSLSLSLSLSRPASSLAAHPRHMVLSSELEPTELEQTLISILMLGSIVELYTTEIARIQTGG